MNQTDAVSISGASIWRPSGTLLLLFLISIFSFSCEQGMKWGAFANEKIVKKDTTQLLLESLQGDSSDQNFLRVIRLVKSDSLRELLKAKRRAMFTRYESFQKLKLDSEAVLEANPCLAPLILKMDRVYNRYFTMKDLLNESYPADDYRAKRYVLGDFNTVDRNGNCRGCVEDYPKIEEMPELKKFIGLAKKAGLDLNDDEQLRDWLAGNWTDTALDGREILAFWKNLRDHVERYRTEPMTRDSIITVLGRKYCVGQRFCLCEIRGDTIVTVAKFVASSKDKRANLRKLVDFDGQSRYYAPMNRLTSRYWDSHLKYDSLDLFHDKHMGYSTKRVVLFEKKTKLPNFMRIHADDAYPGAQNIPNGVHEFAEGGRTTPLYMGTPISYGCIRLHDYPSKFTRWWTPVRAKFVVNYVDSRYIQRPVIVETPPADAVASAEKPKSEGKKEKEKKDEMVKAEDSRERQGGNKPEEPASEKVSEAETKPLLKSPDSTAEIKPLSRPKKRNNRVARKDSTSVAARPAENSKPEKKKKHRKHRSRRERKKEDHTIAQNSSSAGNSGDAVQKSGDDKLH